MSCAMLIFSSFRFSAAQVESVLQSCIRTLRPPMVSAQPSAETHPTKRTGEPTTAKRRRPPNYAQNLALPLNPQHKATHQGDHGSTSKAPSSSRFCDSITADAAAKDQLVNIHSHRLPYVIHIILAVTVLQRYGNHRAKKRNPRPQHICAHELFSAPVGPLPPFGGERLPWRSLSHSLPRSAGN